MIELTKHQADVLRTIGKGKKYVAAMARESDDKDLKTYLDSLFAQDMQLVEWKLAVDITDRKSEKKILSEMAKEDEGRKYFVLKGTRMTGLMFGYGCRDRVIN